MSELRSLLLGLAALAVLAVLLAAVARCGAHRPEAKVDVAAVAVSHG